MSHKHWIGIGAGIFLGLIFVAAGFGKLFSGAESVTILLTPFRQWLTPAIIRTVFDWLPRIELIVGSLLILGIAAKSVAIFAAALITCFIAHNSWLISHGLGYRPCDCLGILERITQHTISGCPKSLLLISSLSAMSES